MKKILILALVLMLMVSLAACGCTNTATEPPATDLNPTNNTNMNPSDLDPGITDMDPTLDTNIPDPSTHGNENSNGSDGDMGTK